MNGCTFNVTEILDNKSRICSAMPLFKTENTYCRWRSTATLLIMKALKHLWRAHSFLTFCFCGLESWLLALCCLWWSNEAIYHVNESGQEISALVCWFYWDHLKFFSVWQTQFILFGLQDFRKLLKREERPMLMMFYAPCESPLSVIIHY